MGANSSAPVASTRRALATALSSPLEIVTFHSSLQGQRATQEDRYLQGPLPESKDVELFCVFDGHMGATAAEFCSENFARHMQNNVNKANGVISSSVLEQSFLDVDKQLLEEKDESAGGCTAGVVAISRSTGQLTSANVGDTRCIVSRAGQPLVLTIDHKPSEPQETKRVLAAGHSIERNRLDGMLAITRALGDKGFKELETDHTPDPKSLHPKDYALSPFPHVVEEAILLGDQFLVVACDGVFEVMTNKSVVDWVKDRLQSLYRKRERRRKRLAAKAASQGGDAPEDNNDDDDSSDDDDDEEEDVAPVALSQTDILELVSDVQKSGGNLALELAGAALAKGSKDNVSVMLVFWGEIDRKEPVKYVDEKGASTTAPVPLMRPTYCTPRQCENPDTCTVQ